MSVLIISTVRSGSTQLLKSVGEYYGKNTVFEPKNKNLFDVKKDVVKIIVNSLSVDEIIKLINEFDNTIILDRKDIYAQSESYLNLWHQLNGRNNSSYISETFSDDLLKETIDKYNKWKFKLKEISDSTNIPITYLEELINGKDIGIGYEKKYFSSKYKLRHEKKYFI